MLFIIMLWMIPFCFNHEIVMAQSTNGAVVQAVLFHSPTCSHCHFVIDNVLMPMIEQYGDKLQIVSIDITQPGGQELYQAAVERYQITPNRNGVPTLIIGDTVLVGDQEIPQQFPPLVKNYLAANGIGWPDIPGLAEVISAQTNPATASPTATLKPTATATMRATSKATLPPRPTSEISTATPPPTEPTSTPPAAVIMDKDSNLPQPQSPPADPLGFALGTIILVGMVMALGYALLLTVQGQIAGNYPMLLRLDRLPHVSSWAIPLLSLMGLGVASYLAYIEISQVEAFCGPIGACNVVQSSPYARIFGVPVALLGMLNYVVVIILWSGQKFLDARLSNLSTLGLLGLTICGTFFSIYLTLLELLVIHAICVWCLSSAVIATALMLMGVVPAVKKSSS